LDLVVCNKCSEISLITSSECINCSAVLPEDSWAKGRFNTARELRRGISNSFSDHFFPKGFNFSKWLKKFYSFFHYVLFFAVLYLFSQPLLIDAPLPVIGFFFIPVSILTFGIQATSTLKSKMPEDEMKLINSYDFIVLGLGFFISVFLCFYFDEDSSGDFEKYTIYILPFAFYFLYRFLFKRPRFVIKEEGLFLYKSKTLIRYSEILFAYPVYVEHDFRGADAAYQWEIRFKLKSERKNLKLGSLLRGDTIIIRTYSYDYLVSAIEEKLKSYNCPMKEGITERWYNSKYSSPHFLHEKQILKKS